MKSESFPNTVFTTVAFIFMAVAGIFYYFHNATLAFICVGSAIFFAIISIFFILRQSSTRHRQIIYLKNLTDGEKRLLRSPIIDAHLSDERLNHTIFASKSDVDAYALSHVNVLIFMCEHANGEIQYKIDDFVISYLRKKKNLKLLT